VLSIALQEAEFLKGEEVTRVAAGKDAIFPYVRRHQQFSNLVELTGQLVLELQGLVGLQLVILTVFISFIPMGKKRRVFMPVPSPLRLQRHCKLVYRFS
jgi:hypothetical protein